MSRGQKVTMQDIADKAGVSKFAVSKALSGKPGVSAATRQNIFQAASQLGYFKSKPFTKMQSSTTEAEKKIVGILIPDIRNQNKESLYWGKILDGISKGFDYQGIGSVIITDDSPEHFKLVIKPEGLMGIIGVGLISTDMLLQLRHLSIPFVLVDHEDDMLASDSIFMNNFDCVRKLTNYLLGLGHTNLQFVGDIRYSRSFFDRWSGFQSALHEKGIAYTANEALLAIKVTNEKDNYELLLSELRGMPADALPAAFVCANDLIAAHVLKALGEIGIRVPEDCSVTGFDNEERYKYADLTTINSEKEAMGAKAVTLLLWRLANRDMPYEKILLYSEIIKGRTASPPQQKTKVPG